MGTTVASNLQEELLGRKIWACFFGAVAIGFYAAGYDRQDLASYESEVCLLNNCIQFWAAPASLALIVIACAYSVLTVVTAMSPSLEEGFQVKNWERNGHRIAGCLSMASGIFAIVLICTVIHAVCRVLSKYSYIECTRDILHPSGDQYYLWVVGGISAFIHGSTSFVVAKKALRLVHVAAV